MPITTWWSSRYPRRPGLTGGTVYSTLTIQIGANCRILPLTIDTRLLDAPCSCLRLRPTARPDVCWAASRSCCLAIRVADGLRLSLAGTLYRQAPILIDLCRIIDAQRVISEIDHQLERAARENPLPRVIPGVAIVEPEVGGRNRKAAGRMNNNRTAWSAAAQYGGASILSRSFHTAP